MSDVIEAIEREDELKRRLATIFPAEKVESELNRLLERKRVNAVRTAETVLLILKEMH